MERRAPKDQKETQESLGQLDPRERRARWAYQAFRVLMVPREKKESQHLIASRRAWPRSLWSQGPPVLLAPLAPWAFRGSRVPRAWMEPRERRVHRVREVLMACLDQSAHQALLGYQEPKERRADLESQDWMVSLDPGEKRATGVNVERRGNEEFLDGKE